MTSRRRSQSVNTSLYIQLQYIRPASATAAEKFTELLDALAAQYYEAIFLDDWNNHAQQKMPT